MNLLTQFLTVISTNTLFKIVFGIDFLIGLIGGFIVALDWKEYGFTFKKNLIPFCILCPSALIVLAITFILAAVDILMDLLEDILT